MRTYTNEACDQLIKKQLIQMVLNESGVRDTAGVLKVNRNTVSNQFKKSKEIIQVNRSYAGKGLRLSLKVDESWSFVGSKKQQRWPW